MARDTQGEDQVRVQVAGAKVKDSGKGVARVARLALDQLGVRDGDPIEIVGKRSTAAIALPPIRRTRVSP